MRVLIIEQKQGEYMRQLTLIYRQRLKTDSRMNKAFEYTFNAHEEHLNPSLDLFDCVEDIDYINNQLSKGNQSAWFCAEVKASWNGIEVSDYLGCCSYKSFDEFVNEKDGYIDDMISSVTDELEKRIKNIINEASKLDLKGE